MPDERVIGIGELTRRHAVPVGGHHHRRTVLVCPADHQRRCPSAVIARTSAGTRARHVADMARPARVRPRGRDQDLCGAATGRAPSEVGAGLDDTSGCRPPAPKPPSASSTARNASGAAGGHGRHRDRHVRCPRARLGLRDRQAVARKQRDKRRRGRSRRNARRPVGDRTRPQARRHRRVARRRAAGASTRRIPRRAPVSGSTTAFAAASLPQQALTPEAQRGHQGQVRGPRSHRRRGGRRIGSPERVVVGSVTAAVRWPPARTQ